MKDISISFRENLNCNRNISILFGYCDVPFDGRNFKKLGIWYKFWEYSFASENIILPISGKIMLFFILVF